MVQANTRANSKLIVITGVTRGLGLAMAEKFIELGHTVLGCGRNQKDIESLRKRFGASHDFEALDVSSDPAVKKWAARVLKSHGAPDLLLNNAALINETAPLWKVPAEEFSSVIDVNIKGVANTIRHFVPAMIENKHGVIVNFSSGWGRSTSPGVAPYCATKFAIEGLSQALADDLPEGMASIPLNPGIINTDMLQSCFGGSAGSYPEPKDWAERAVPFLLKLSAKDNGQSLSVP
jgi:NAD(P)-dependent dehydrogenase (short-subunit alcohol dehydrogenase family)